jgi:gas vesicle protein
MYMNTTGKIIVGFVAGAVLGTITGLLVAPTTGNRTRKNISKKSKKLMKQLASYVKGKQERPRASGAHNKNGKAAVATTR